MKKRSRALIFKIFLGLFALVAVVTPSTFTHVPDIERRVIISVLGLDAAEEGYTVSAQVIVPKRATEGDPKQEVVSTSGKSVSEGIDKLNRAMGRTVELGHCGVVVIGKSLAQKGVKSELEYLFAGGLTTPGANPVLVDNAEGFLKKSLPLAAGSATGLDSFITFAASGAHTATLCMNRFLCASEGESKTSYMPYLEMDDKSQDGGGESGGNSGGGSGENGGGSAGESAQKTSFIKSAETVAVFYDGVYKATFSPEVTRGVVWVDKKSSEGQVQLDDFTVDGVSYGGQYGKLKRKSRKFCARFIDGKPVFTVKMHVKIELEDKHKLNEVSDKIGLAQATIALRNAFTQKIENEVRAAHKAGLELGVDILEMRSAFYRMAHDEYKKYGQENFLSDVELKFIIDMKVD